MILIRFPNGHTTWRCQSIQTPINPWKRYYSLEKIQIIHPIIYFNNVQVQRAIQQKHLGIIFVEKLNFRCHINKVLTKTNKGIAVIKRLRNFLPRKYKLPFIKQLLDLILSMKIFCTTNLIAPLFVKSWICSKQSSSFNYWCNSRYLPRKTFGRIGTWNT